MTWQEYQPSSSLGQLPPEINTEHAQPSKTITRSTNSISQNLTPKTLPHEKTMDDEANDYLPMIIQSGKRVTFADNNKMESSETPSDIPLSKELAEAPVRTPFPLDRVDTPETVGANTEAIPVSVQSHNCEPCNINDELGIKLPIFINHLVFF